MATFNYVICSSNGYVDGTINGNDNNFLVIDGDTLRITNRRTPASSTDSGYQGEICYDSNYIYVCINSNTWKRASLVTF